MTISNFNGLVTKDSVGNTVTVIGIEESSRNCFIVELSDGNCATFYPIRETLTEALNWWGYEIVEQGTW